MVRTLKQFKAKAMEDPEFRKAYDALEEEFAFLDEVWKARANAGLTQAEIAERLGTTQSAVARLESGTGNPSVGTLKRYATALGCRLEVKLVKTPGAVHDKPVASKRRKRA